MNDYTIYIVAGIATSPNFFVNLNNSLKIYFSESFKKVEIQMIYPYGDWNTRVSVQVNKALRDYKRRDLSYSAQQIRKSIVEHYASGKIVILGHSAGGMCGYHAIHLLERLDGIHVHRLVQIGSPKVCIHSKYVEKVAYIRTKWGADWITRLGSWGGMSRTGYSIPYWNRYKHAPKHRWELELVGGHPDYFRNQEPFVDQQGMSNLSKTMRIILSFI